MLQRVAQIYGHFGNDNFDDTYLVNDHWTRF